MRQKVHLSSTLFGFHRISSNVWRRIQRKTWCMGPSYAGVDCNLTLGPLQNRLQHIYHEQVYVRVDLNPITESTLSPSQGLGDLSVPSAPLSLLNVCTYIVHVYNIHPPLLFQLYSSILQFFIHLRCTTHVIIASIT